MSPVLSAGLAGLRANTVPGIILWCIGSALLLAYWQVAPVRPVFAAVESAQHAGGLLFSAVLVGRSGGMIPFLGSWGSGRIRAGRAAPGSLCSSC